jgi:DNA-binding Lrp family transcriptional regulator
MDQLDRRLLNRLQRSVPLVREPFAELAAELGCQEQTVLERIAALRGQGGVIREISAIFDAAALGYEQALVAMRTPPDRLDHAGQVAASHPGVSHCYAREGEVNLWLTLAVSPRSALGLSATAELLARRCGAAACMVLPTLRRYKLEVWFDLENAGAAGGGGRSASAGSALSPAPLPGHRRPPPLSDEQLRAVRALQMDLPCRRDPFSPLAEAEGLDADSLLVHAADFLAAGWMRRYAAVLHHLAAGSAANVLVAWAVAEPVADAAGARCARLPAVSHCYLRPAAPGWPYRLYTMIHGRSREDCRMTIRQIAATTGLGERAELWTARQYKKQRLVLFTDAEAQWEQRQPPPAE